MESIISDSFSTTTLLGSAAVISKLLPIDYDQQKEFTLNTHLNIVPNEDMPTEPKLKYFGVGLGGAYNVDDGFLSAAYKPDRRNMNLYNLIPIRCRPVDEDLSDAERMNYRLRQRATIGGKEYFLYYLKVLNFDGGIGFKRYAVSGKEEPYELDASNLTPKPVKPKDDDLINTSSSSIIAYCNATLDLSAGEVLEYVRVKYNGDTRYAKISELGLFTGADKQITSTTGQNVPVVYTESVGTLLFNHTTWLGTTLSSEGMTMSSNFIITSTGVTIK